MTVDGSTTATPTFVDVPPAPPTPHDGGGPTAGFRLAATLTTVRQYWHYLVDQGLDRAPAPLLHGLPTTAGTGLRTTPAGTVEIDRALDDLPVVWVTWHGAIAYCTWLAARTGVPCRLPSAAEWRHAAAGPARFRWALGNDFDRPVYAPAATGPRPVGHTPANGFGLHDMTGNVFEWCQDPLTAPGGAEAESLGSRVIKGGAYTVRNPESFDNATIFTADELSAVPYIGFRVLSLPVPARRP
ncbi:formylglycine-generating enzyme family protein [Micromonospora narathiwatensis]|uniref:Sulfatase-modifying factor enzyme 1 n=1 Tax=Micromonospora narathiwatensis TaxID=299146 RepID=A0A1A8ZB39_9ACTN|nr:SUMF1/EgtB/PvdO family nonheme iron enzyme [Micromonospora narathiwatensis]SBT41085.1 Sulfatase-modifying factor enzyme 1 [Micromonospora narathiwatensis]